MIITKKQPDIIIETGNSTRIAAILKVSTGFRFHPLMAPPGHEDLIIYNDILIFPAANGLKSKGLNVMKWVRLLNARNEIEAGMICGLLEGEGILTTRKYKGPNQYLSIVMGPVAELEIWVPEDKLKEAAGIFKAFFNP